jgi:catechol 2,3-dioxygenase-like lactoylglutathione lyase family enzyme
VPSSEPEIAAVTLGAPADALERLAAFYGERWGLPVESGGDTLTVTAGRSRLTFAPVADARPFYHFALLVPGDRFDAALAWLRERTDLLPDPESGEPVFDFGFWDARACYCHDPAGNIVELIAHRDTPGAFADGRDLLGISEIGLVTPDPQATADEVRDELGLELWSGGFDGLAFVGRKAHTLILCRPGRGWLPTGRPAERHPVEVAVSGRGRLRH